MQSTPIHNLFLDFILLPSFHLYLSFLHVSLQIRTFCAYLVHPICVTCPAHLILLDLSALPVERWTQGWNLLEAFAFSCACCRGWAQMPCNVSTAVSVALKLFRTKQDARRYRWPRGLRRGSAAALSLGLRVRIPWGHKCLSLLSVVSVVR
jgi:hypothetical protein